MRDRCVGGREEQKVILAHVDMEGRDPKDPDVRFPELVEAYSSVETSQDNLEGTSANRRTVRTALVPKWAAQEAVKKTRDRQPCSASVGLKGPIRHLLQ